MITFSNTITAGSEAASGAAVVVATDAAAAVIATDAAVAVVDDAYVPQASVCLVLILWLVYLYILLSTYHNC